MQDTLVACWEKGIRTFACCGGHKNEVSEPYLGILIDEKSIETIKRIIGSLQDMKDITMFTGIRSIGIGGRDVLPDSECRGFSVYGNNHNRCELFYRVSNAINDERDIELTDKAKYFFDRVNSVYEGEYEDIVLDHIDGIPWTSVFNNNSTDLIEYRNKNRNFDITKVPIIGKILQKVLSKIKLNSEKNKELKGKYDTFQESYAPTTPTLKETLKQGVEERKNEPAIQVKETKERSNDNVRE